MFPWPSQIVVSKYFQQNKYNFNPAFSFFFFLLYFYWEWEGKKNWLKPVSSPDKWEKIFSILFLSLNNHLLSVYGIQISNNDYLSWFSSHLHYFCFIKENTLFVLDNINNKTTLLWNLFNFNIFRDFYLLFTKKEYLILCEQEIEISKYIKVKKIS